MARVTNKTALAVKMQTVAGTFDAPNSTTDLYPVSNLRPDIQAVNVSSQEYTGTIQKNGPLVAGKTVSGSFNIDLRHPGGATVPAADTFVPGRFLKAAKFSEIITAAAIPAAPEALTAGTVNSATLGAGATATAGLYKGMAVELSDKGATARDRMTAIRSFTAGKIATFMYPFPTAPAANYQIPKQLTYARSIDESEAPFLSMSQWISGIRYDLVDVRISGLRIVLPVSTRDGAAIPQLEISYTASIAAYADQPSPAIPSLGTAPLFKDGKLYLASKAVGGSNVSADFGLQSFYPPNPNFVDGSEGGLLTESTTTVNMDRTAYLKAELDTLALADAQAQHALFAQWGYANLIQFVVPDCRFNYQSIDLGGEIVTERGDLFVDVFDRNFAMNFVWPS